MNHGPVTRHRRPKLSPDMERCIAEVAEAAAEKAAKRAAHRAVRDVLLALGVDTETAAAHIQTQQDHDFLRRLRKFSQSAQSKILLSCVATAIAALGGLLAMFLSNHFPTIFTLPK